MSSGWWLRHCTLYNNRTENEEFYRKCFVVLNLKTFAYVKNGILFNRQKFYFCTEPSHRSYTGKTICLDLLSHFGPLARYKKDR